MREGWRWRGGIGGSGGGSSGLPSAFAHRARCFAARVLLRRRADGPVRLRPSLPLTCGPAPSWLAAAGCCSLMPSTARHSRPRGQSPRADKSHASRRHPSRFSAEAARPRQRDTPLLREATTRPWIRLFFFASYILSTPEYLLSSLFFSCG